MPQSPKCPKCLEAAVIAQTFRVAGSAQFKCGRCKEYFQKSDFEPIEFEWLEKPKEWNEFHDLRPTNEIINGNISKAEKSTKTKKKIRGI